VKNNFYCYDCYDVYVHIKLVACCALFAAGRHFCRESELKYDGTDKSLDRSGRKEANVSVRMV